MASSKMSAMLDIEEQHSRLTKKHNDMRRQMQELKMDHTEMNYHRESLAQQLWREKKEHKTLQASVALIKSQSESALQQNKKMMHETAVMRQQYFQDRRLAQRCLRAKDAVLDEAQAARAQERAAHAERLADYRAKLKEARQRPATAGGRGAPDGRPRTASATSADAKKPVPPLESKGS